MIIAHAPSPIHRERIRVFMEHLREVDELMM